MSRNLLANAVRAAAPRPMPALRTRALPLLCHYSSSSPSAKPSIIFTKASSPELDAVFSDILHKIILPARLPRAKRKIVFNSKFRRQLLTDPIVIEVDGYEHQFDTLDWRNGDVPSSANLLSRAVFLMKTQDDWDNLVRLLAGFRSAKRIIKPWHYHALIREAGKSGNIWAIINALRHEEESGLYLDSLPRTDEILYWVQMMAVESGWAKKETGKALTWAEMVFAILQDPAHGRRTPKLPHQADLHREPQVVGQILHLAAANALYHNEGKDVDGKVAQYAALLAHLWKPGKGLANMHEPEPYSADMTTAQRIAFQTKSDNYLAEAPSRLIATASHILHGCQLAAKVAGPETAARLEPVAQALQAELDAFLAKRDQVVAARGWRVYDTLLGEGAEEEATPAES